MKLNEIALIKEKLNWNLLKVPKDEMSKMRGEIIACIFESENIYVFDIMGDECINGIGYTSIDKLIEIKPDSASEYIFEKSTGSIFRIEEC